MLWAKRAETLLQSMPNYCQNSSFELGASATALPGRAVADTLTLARDVHAMSD